MRSPASTTYIITQDLLKACNLTIKSRPIVMFAIVVVVANLMFIIFFILAFLLSKYPIQMMKL